MRCDLSSGSDNERGLSSSGPGDGKGDLDFDRPLACEGGADCGTVTKYQVVLLANSLQCQSLHGTSLARNCCGVSKLALDVAMWQCHAVCIWGRIWFAALQQFHSSEIAHKTTNNDAQRADNQVKTSMLCFKCWLPILPWKGYRNTKGKLQAFSHVHKYCWDMAYSCNRWTLCFDSLDSCFSFCNLSFEPLNFSLQHTVACRVTHVDGDLELACCDAMYYST